MSLIPFMDTMMNDPFFNMPGMGTWPGMTGWPSLGTLPSMGLMNRPLGPMERIRTYVFVHFCDKSEPTQHKISP
jgi:hypothetical protein